MDKVSLFTCVIWYILCSFVSDSTCKYFISEIIFEPVKLSNNMSFYRGKVIAPEEYVEKVARRISDIIQPHEFSGGQFPLDDFVFDLK